MPPRGVRRKSSTQDDDKELAALSAVQRLLSKVKVAIEKKQKVNACLSALQNLIDKNKICIGCKLSNPLRSKVLTLYQNAKEASESEEAYLRSLLKDIEKLRRLRYEESKHGSLMRRGALIQLLSAHARSTPLWIGPADSHPPPLVGAIPAPDSMPIEVGSEVAAFVDNIWMLGEVLGVSSNGKYDVRDVDDEQKAKHAVRRSRLIPLPQWRTDPMRDSHALFPKNAIVLALYPQTTCFYKGVVEYVPETATDDYLIAFEDSSFPQGYSPPLPVPQRYVLTHKVPRRYRRRDRQNDMEE